MTMPYFWKITPGGNPTVLLRSDEVAPALRSSAASAIMSPLHLGCEQAGFVDLDSTPPRLDMMGGEFCLNATRAFAALLAQEGRLRGPSCHLTNPHLSIWDGEVAVSGVDSTVQVRVQQHKGRSGYTASACLHFADLPLPIPHTVQGSQAIVVRVPGITHVVMENEPMPPQSDLADICAGLRHKLGLTKEDAVGCLWLDSRIEPALLQPVVWVRATQSLCLESACGSGTLAGALILHQRTGQSCLAVRQPSGDCLHIRMEPGPNGSMNIWVDGPVYMVAQGCLELPDLRSTSFP